MDCGRGSGRDQTEGREQVASPRALLSAIRQETDPAAKAELANAFLTRMESASRRIAYRYCQNLMLDHTTWLPDIHQCIRTAAHGIITDYANGRLPTVEPCQPLLTMRARQTVAEFLSTADGVCRFCGREPTDQDVADAAHRGRPPSRIDPPHVGTVRIEDLTTDPNT